MSGTNGLWSAALLALALVPGARAHAQDCPSGAVNTITGNYTGDGTVVGQDVAGTDRCEVCLIVRAQVADDGTFGHWEEVGRVCDIWTDAKAHEVMFRIGQCGLIVPVFEGVGQFYGASVPIRVEAFRLPPCA